MKIRHLRAAKHPGPKSLTVVLMAGFVDVESGLLRDLLADLVIGGRQGPVDFVEGLGD